MNPMMLSRHRHGVLVECLAQRADPLAMSEHFALYGLDLAADGVLPPEDMVVVHDFLPAQIDNNIGYYVANELLPLFVGICQAQELADNYAYSEQQIFEHYVGEIVRSMHGNERRAWHLFYDNTLRAFQQAAGHIGGGTEEDFISDFRAIYQQAIELMNEPESQPSTVLDVATCFGFFPFLLADQLFGKSAKPMSIVGCDLNLALVELANDYAVYRQLSEVTFNRADILADNVQALLPWPGFDAITAIHLLEHLEPWQTELAVANLWKLTERRLIIAVPFEKIPDVRFGHRQVFEKERLIAIGRQLGGNYHYFEYHGGWIVIDRP